MIAPGSDADLVIMRTGVEDVITAKDQVQNVDYAPFEGTKVTGRVVSVFLRGLQAVKDGRLSASVLQDADGQASAVIDVAAKVGVGEEVESRYNVPFQLITADNVDDYLE